MEEKRILKNKLFLYLTEFFAGMSVMAIELGAQRMLAPYFSSSQIVWTIVIGSIMIAMALGNIYGGRKADKDPNPNKLYARLIIAASWLALIPWLGKYVIAGISAVLIFAVSSGYLVVAATASCIVLFIFPLFLLGTTTPCLVKYATKSLDESGKTVGMLGAFNTIGSILGTFLPTFVTIPTIGTNLTFLIFAFILFVLALIYFISLKVFQKKSVVALVLLIVGTIFGYKSAFAFWDEDPLYEGESMYNYLRVTESDSEIELSTNVLFGVQSLYSPVKRLRSSHYYDSALAAVLMAKADNDKREVLILGNGSGTYATQIDRYFDNVEITGVEIDGKITDLAYDYFNLSEEHKIYTYDGRAYLNVTKEKYDVIMVDAYQDITIPFQMSSVEFFTLVKEHLNDNGVMVVNLNMRSNEEGNINFYLCDTIASIFPVVYTVDIKGSTNRLLYASMNNNMIDDFHNQLENTTDEELKDFLDFNVSERLEDYQKGNLIFTDDKAPVELLGISVIDTLIDEEVDFYKKIFKEQGLKGLLDYLGN
ncbi:MAG: fused MFS/spermidine synthase [Bacilli bacterium]|nr:fused MFS/spermidine synthase [Bacilli bacterium]